MSVLFRTDWPAPDVAAMPAENRKEMGLIGYQALFNIARQDAQQAGKLLRESGEGFYRRAFVRAIFAYIEADVWGRKRVALYIHELNSSIPILTVAEVVIASEENAILAEDGSVGTTSTRLKLLPNLKFSFRVFAAAFDVQNYHLEIGDAGWSDLRKAVGIRDRLMHPKGGRDFNVSDEEIAICGGAMGWYDAASMRLLDLATARLGA